MSELPHLTHLVIGGGNGAHVFAGLSASRENVSCRVLSLFADEAERWRKTVEDVGHFTVHGRETDNTPFEIKSKPELITNDPALACKDVDLITFCVPAFGHEQYFQAIKDHIPDGATLVGIPSSAGFEFAARGILGEKAQSCTIMTFESLPWACRIDSYGKVVSILGYKEELSGAVSECVAIEGKPHIPAAQAVAELQRVLGPNPHLNVKGHILGVTLMGTNAYIHPSIMYGRWHDYDGTHLDTEPLFYQGVDQKSADVLSNVSAEVVEIAKTIMKLRPNVDLTTVRSCYQWYLDCYGHQITDKTSLKTCLNTFPGYDGLTHPMSKTDDGKYVPNFKYRYLSEDLPYGLAVLRGIAEILKLATPHLDEVLCWGQTALGKEYLVGDKMVGKDICETRCPQKYGFTTVDQLLGNIDYSQFS